VPKAGTQAASDVMQPALAEYYFDNLVPTAKDPDSKWEPHGKRRFNEVHADKVAEVAARTVRACT
jgi:hypothetical protein